MYRGRFRTRLIAIFLFTTIVQGLVIGLFSYNNARDIVISNKQRDMRNQLNLVDININVQVRYFTSLIENMAASEAVRSLLENGQSGGVSALVSESFASMHTALGSANHILLANGEQVLVAHYPDNHNQRKPTFSGQLKSVYESALRQTSTVQWHGVAQSIVPHSAIGTQVILITCPINTAQGGGVLMVELDTQTFGNILLNTQNTFQNEYTFVIDKQNQLVCSNKLVDALWLETVAETFDSGTRRFSAEWSDTLYYVYGQYNGITGWRSFSVLSADYMVHQTEPLRQFIMLCIIVTTGAMSLVIIAVTYTMTRPVQQLSRAMETVQGGDFSVRLESRRRDELGNLMQSFDFMTEKIDTLIHEVYAKKIALQNAEMEALQSQINPHFLYNTLDSINWMLIDRGETDVSEVIVALGDLMKYAVDKDSAIVELEQEMHYIRSYLFIQKTRMEDRLQIAIDVPEELYPFPVPKLILQPIVENAILHGIAGRERGGVLSITARQDGDCLVIEVADDGQGIPAETLEELRRTLRQDKAVSSIGVSNVNRRIRIHYGPGYGLHIASGAGAGTTVTIRIPPAERAQREQEETP